MAQKKAVKVYGFTSTDTWRMGYVRTIWGVSKEGVQLASFDCPHAAVDYAKSLVTRGLKEIDLEPCVIEAQKQNPKAA